jgi:hypothetical protein
MLKLDRETSSIPVLTCTTESEEEDPDVTIAQMAEDEEDAFRSRPLLMN